MNNMIPAHLKLEMNAGATDGYVVHDLHVTPVLLLLLQKHVMNDERSHCDTH